METNKQLRRTKRVNRTSSSEHIWINLHSPDRKKVYEIHYNVKNERFKLFDMSNDIFGIGCNLSKLSYGARSIWISQPGTLYFALLSTISNLDFRLRRRKIWTIILSNWWMKILLDLTILLTILLAIINSFYISINFWLKGFPVGPVPEADVFRWSTMLHRLCNIVYAAKGERFYSVMTRKSHC